MVFGNVNHMLAEGSVFDSIKDAINAICQPAPFLIVAVAALVVFLVGYRTFTRPVVAIPLAVAFTVFFIA
ncbi:MAG: hypothetical protein Q7R41_00605, partial [Phycisphaerales bacterium]|nr:hypothetical protein [Phycisphaerales bacterium]